MKSMITGTLPTVNVFDTTKANIATPDDDRFANGWQYQDKAFCEYFNFFWNETSTSLTQMNPFVYNLNDEISQLVAYVKSLDSSVQFDTAENNWLLNVTKYLKGLVDTEATNRDNADTALKNSLITKIDTETANRQNAISALETSLTEKIASEETARKAADTALQSDITDIDDKLGTYTNTGAINNTGYFSNTNTFTNTSTVKIGSNLLIGSKETPVTITAEQNLDLPMYTYFSVAKDSSTSTIIGAVTEIYTSGNGLEKSLLGEYYGFQLAIDTIKNTVSTSSIPGIVVKRIYGICCASVIKSTTNPSDLVISNQTDTKLEFQLLGGGSVQFTLPAKSMTTVSSGYAWWYRWYPAYNQ